MSKGKKAHRKAARASPPESPGDDEAARPTAGPGGELVRASWIGTAVFGVSATAGAVVPDVLGVPSAVVAGVLFALGCGAFLWAYATAGGRSRTDAIGIGGLFFLTRTAPAAGRRALLGALGAQALVALVTASVRPFTSLAFGILVPVYGLGLAGLWAARHGTFAPRE